MTAASREPQPVHAAVLKLNAMLAKRGIDPNAPLPEDPPEHLAALELAEARIPDLYKNAVADHPTVQAWIQEIARLGRTGPGGAPGIDHGPSLLILGPVGRGKTRQAYGTVRGLLTTGVRLRWQLITAADMYSALSPRPRVDSEAEFWRLARCPLLIIDDLGADNPSEWARKMTYRLINYRYSERLPTVFTTDLTPAELRAAIGERSASRLVEMAYPVVLDGEDHRRDPARRAGFQMAPALPPRPTGFPSGSPASGPRR
ncbi:ATP-binding protein [Streptomyces sp. NBC_01304]|uniref:ATP-binding protein n=1 Tax=Streptomyces sp. NBC_01304 TaxID=2903818 RepID=UPI002E10914B|nr:ATP-binding protein [Streptomyces sp. NBC_01304]